MLSEIIAAYLYQQYADDEDVQGIVDATNLAMGYYLNWFNQIGLPDYTNLQAQTVGGHVTGYVVDPGLLDWVLTNLYNMPRPSISITTGGDTGPLNTAPLNTMPVNAYAFATAHDYYVDDDWYQRIATWNLYAGDGKNFNMRWLKRRIMRFFLGAHGVDPFPGQMTAYGTTYVGCETTWPIGVTVANVSGVRTMTITIDQSELSSMATNLRSNVIDIFKASLLAGVLEMPVWYQYAVNVETTINISIIGLPATFDSASSGITGSVTATVSGGTPGYTYAWSWSSGGAGISILNATTDTPTFDGTLPAGGTRSGIARCVVTDSVGGQNIAAFPVMLHNTNQPLTISASPSSVSASGSGFRTTINTVPVTAVMAGGFPAYTDLGWEWDSGGGGITINVTVNNAGEGTAHFTATPAEGQKLSGVCKVGGSDSGFETVWAYVPVSITNTD